jgi:gluconolactonase
VDLATGEVRTLYTECEGQRLIGPNDLVFDRHGGFWFTDHGCGNEHSRQFGALYYALPDGSRIVRASPPLLAPNGVGLSPDETVVYVADTYMGRLWAFDVLARRGAAGLALPAGRVVANLPGCQFLDSLAVQADGQVCVATILNGGITVFDPVSGQTEHAAVPDLVCTNLCFGGADMRDVWITASGTGRVYRTRWPRPGLRLNYPPAAA